MYERETQVAIAAVTAAAQLCERVRQQSSSPTLAKPDRTPVTVADFACQAAICQALAEAFAADPIIAEEDATLLQQPGNAQLLASVTNYVQAIIPQANSEAVTDWINRGKGEIASRYWTLDPIDGTKGFIRGNQYAIALALIEAGEVRVGILACPALAVDCQQPQGEKGVVFVAVNNQGTRMKPLQGGDWRPIRVNSLADVRLVRPLESVESAHSDRHQQVAVAQLLGLTQTAVRLDSQAKYGAVARGEGDFYLRIPLPQFRSGKENIWDHAAGSIIVSEAGGKVSDLNGKPLDFSLGSKLSQNHGIVASNATIHQRLIQAWQELCSPSQ